MVLILTKCGQVDGLDWEERLSSTLPTPRDPRVVRLLLEAGARLSTEEDRGEAGDGESGCECAEVVTSSQVCTRCVLTAMPVIVLLCLSHKWWNTFLK